MKSKLTTDTERPAETPGKPTVPSPDQPVKPVRVLFGIREKLISIFVIIKVLPLIVLALFAAQQIDILGKTVREKSSEMVGDTRNLVNQVGELATESSIRALDLKSRENIERLTTDTARRVAEFLYERDNDILIVANLPILKDEFRKFLNARKKDVVYHKPWQLSQDGSEWLPSSEPEVAAAVEAVIPDNRREFHYRPPETAGMIRSQPLYHELTFVSLEGKERIKISATDLLSKELRDVSQVRNTWCSAETYFADIEKLKDGEVYVSRVIGPYIPSPIIGKFTPLRAKEKNIPFHPEEAGYAGKENPVGKRFKGIIRWATPVYRDGVKLGYVTLALDHTHLMEFTDHLVPTEERYSDISDAGSGNYAFMWDFLGRNISHPRDYFIVGFDPERGEQAVPWLSSELYDLWVQSHSFAAFEAGAETFLEQSLSKSPSAELTRAGMLGLDCRYLNFAPQCNGWATLTQFGGSGSFVIFWSNLWKLTTAAAIPYYTGMYGTTPRGFGFVTIGANVDEFHSSATETAARIKSITSSYEKDLEEKKQDTLARIDTLMKNTVKNLTFSTAIMALLVVLIAVWMAATITGKIVTIIRGIRHFQKGEFSDKLDVNSQDELGELAAAFNEMAETIEHSIAEIATARDRAEESDKAKSIFLANMSHEIRTPMNAIIGMSRLALEASENEQQKQLLSGVKTSADSLLAVVNDILDFSKIEAGQLDLESHVFALHELIKSAVNSVSILIEDKKLAISCHIADDVPRIVLGDQMRLRQILLNLLGNAVKFTKQGNVDLFVNCRESDGDLVDIAFEVHDTGIGIAENHIDMIFDSFSQGDVSISRQHQGTGLGLAISRKLCNLMGGDITVKSEVGKGSVFYFNVLFLPVEQENNSVDRKKTNATFSINPLDILLVEDNMANRDLARMVLEQDGHRVTTAESGLEALEQLASNTFDIVLMDVQMPEMDGFTATKIIRACETQRALKFDIPDAIEERLRARMAGDHQPVIALTAHAMRGDKEKCVDAGMDDYLTKPFQPDHVAVVLQKYGSRKRTDPLPARFVDNKDTSIGESLYKRARNNLCEAYALPEEKVVGLLDSTIPVIRENVGQLEAAITTSDLTEIRKIVHALKGVLLNLRLYEESALAEQMQRKAEAKDLASLPGILQKLKACLQEFLDGR